METVWCGDSKDVESLLAWGGGGTQSRLTPPFFFKIEIEAWDMDTMDTSWIQKDKNIYLSILTHIYYKTMFMPTRPIAEPVDFKDITQSLKTIYIRRSKYRRDRKKPAVYNSLDYIEILNKLKRLQQYGYVKDTNDTLEYELTEQGFNFVKLFSLS
jgi:hypothetical protein